MAKPNRRDYGFGLTRLMLLANTRRAADLTAVRRRSTPRLALAGSVAIHRITMRVGDGNNLCGRLFAFSYAAFETPPPPVVDAWSYGVTVVATLFFLAAAFVIYVTLNIGTLPFGVYVEPVWRPNHRFRRLSFPGGIPVIAVALPVLLAISGWRTWLLRGPFDVFAPFVVIGILGPLLLAGLALWNRVRARLDARPSG